MKTLVVIFILAFPFSACFGTCDKSGLFVSNTIIQNNDTTIMSNQVKIKIGSSSFTATLFDNATATAFKAMLPITVKMTELNGNEKYFDLSTNLPTSASKPGTIHTGDLMIWGSNTLVLFYKVFSTSYSYTKLGKVDDVSGLAAAVGSGNVKVTFELE
jgi:hypothetical protein